MAKDIGRRSIGVIYSGYEGIGNPTSGLRVPYPTFQEEKVKNFTDDNLLSTEAICGD